MIRVKVTGEVHPERVGWIEVIFEDQKRWAKPSMPPGFASYPTANFLEKYKNMVNAWVIPENLDGKCNQLVWVGFTYSDDFAKVADEKVKQYGNFKNLYPNAKLFPFVPFIILVDEENGMVNIYSVEDESFIRVDFREQVDVESHQTGSRTTTIDIDDTIVVKKNISVTSEEGDASLSVNDGSYSIDVSKDVTVKCENANIEASGNVDVRAGNIKMQNGTQYVNCLPTCLFTGADHSPFNKTVKVGD